MEILTGILMARDPCGVREVPGVRIPPGTMGFFSDVGHFYTWWVIRSSSREHQKFQCPPPDLWSLSL